MKYTGFALAFASTALGQTLQEVIANTSSLSSLGGLLQGVTLPQLTNNTLLAPSNEAIAAFTNSSTAGALATDPQLISAILSYHVLQGNYSTITNTSFIPSLVQPPTYANVTGGQRVEALVSDGNVTFFSGLLQNSSIVNASIPFNGGTIHIIDTLLTLPQNVSATAVALNLTSAAGALIARNLVTTLDHAQDVTIFVPNNAAFARIGSALANASNDTLDSVLQYHVHQGTVLYSTDIRNGSSVPTLLEGSNLTITTSGSDVFVNNARVIQPNVLIAGGVIHVIDRVLNPANSTLTPNASATEDAFGGATSVSDEPFTSGVPTPTSSVNTGAAGSAASSAASSSGGAARPMETGGMALAALFGGAAAVLNF